YGYSDTTLKINHAALSTLSADYTNVTAMLTDSNGNILYYGSINETTSATESTITIPAGLAAGEYTLSVYGEDWNGEKLTDYATGTPYTIKITVHEHSWATAWNSDSTHHWHECQNSNCPVTDNSGKNGYTEPTPDAAATETTAQICTVCEYEINPALGHTYGAEWKFDSTHHWYECSCGAKSEVSTHNHDNDKDAICDTCGYVRVLAANPIEITRQPTDSLILEGQRAEFSVEAIGDGLTYQWYINRNDGRGWREIHGAVAAVHVPSVTDLDCEGFRYECMITDQYDNTLKSDEAVLHVSAVPPKTGDNSNHMLWMAMGLLSMAGILLLRRKAFAG
ncbi:MAG: LPXTG cell wall anchor domain-containing protein, partial [Clostridia bacterium]|nr:LPXTG cell wall anchor domain-containing protein [Clostridia bacterium]